MTWLVEEGIGEERAIRIEHGQAIAARIYWPNSLAPGLVEDAVLVSRTKGSRRGRARFASGEEALVDRLPQQASEGAALRMVVTRAHMGEKNRVKLAQARPSDADCRPAPSLYERLAATGTETTLVRQFPGNDWEDIWSEAWTGICDFAGGSLHFAPTPAMTMVDIDGHLPPRELAMAACEPLAHTIARFALTGSIGVDFPTLQTKTDRKAVDETLACEMAEWNHESTAMNGFGFVQLIARLELPSLLHLLTYHRSGAAARLLLRRAERISEPGALLLTAHPAVLPALSEEWLGQLARRSGRDIRQAADPGLALESGFAQAVEL